MTQGYRKIPGDKCEGGTTPERKVVDMSQKCVSNLLTPQVQAHSSALIVVAVVAVMLLSVVAGVLFIKKYVCGGRFLVHRYSVLQQHAEANGIEGVDATGDVLDTRAAQPPKRDYHDDSDEDLLE
ncbi:hypothetical protein AAFF_G00276810 [Aldrovandia affinis]|uniref:Sortilin n=1 Tax=Aldrovandia affinis TaxID=143900 RepID=A0AAD7W1D3_9TELE|nr:hypothetical protein AAFF_G00276810 [Aldrovandia affinis]